MKQPFRYTLAPAIKLAPAINVVINTDLNAYTGNAYTGNTYTGNAYKAAGMSDKATSRSERLIPNCWRYCLAESNDLDINTSQAHNTRQPL
jgi:hypothetical protein